MLVGRRDKQDPAFSRLLYQLSRAGANDELAAYISVVAISNDARMIESVGTPSRVRPDCGPSAVAVRPDSANHAN